mgnify:CR=1 FL=1
MKTKQPKKPKYKLTQAQKDEVDKAYKEGRILAEDIDLKITSKKDLLKALINNERLLQQQQRTIDKLVRFFKPKKHEEEPK